MQSKLILNERDFLGGENGETIERLLTYHLAGKQERDLLSSIVPVDSSSFVNLSHLVSTLVTHFMAILSPRSFR